MANPARIPDPRSQDPLDPAAAQPALDPVTGEPRSAANHDRPGVVNRVETRSSGSSSVLIAAVVIVLAIVAYFVFVPASNEGVVEAPAPAVTTESAPDATAPADTVAPETAAPEAPADTTAPAPEAAAPEAPADTTAPAPEATAPEAPAADSAAPVPAEPAPAQ